LKKLAQKARKNARARFLAPFDPLIEQLDAAREAEVYPFFASSDSAAAQEELCDGAVIFVANDYLGLTGDQRVRDAAREAISAFGTSRCSSPLAGGHTRLHRLLERRLATYLEQDAAVLFASGYQANVGAISALVGQDDLILSYLYMKCLLLE
jgi:7-keto-8-aminopelargonate synthetase-like enzyme